MTLRYRRFAAMIVTSTLVMFGLMYLNTYALSHLEYSQTRTCMALLMGACMAIVMLGFMWDMYPGLQVKVAILCGAAIVFSASLWLVRSQATVGDVSYLKAMIPHHSIAIMTSERAQIRDPEVRMLADRIIDAQLREIAEMKRAIARLQKQPVPAKAAVLLSYRDRGVAPPPPDTDQNANLNTLKPVR